MINIDRIIKSIKQTYKSKSELMSLFHKYFTSEKIENTLGKEFNKYGFLICGMEVPQEGSFSFSVFVKSSNCEVELLVSKVLPFYYVINEVNELAFLTQISAIMSSQGYEMIENIDELLKTKLDNTDEMFKYIPNLYYLLFGYDG